ncbi:MAG: IclR family transcriptional regulator [Gammaproteobacteria bacterium]
MEDQDTDEFVRSLARGLAVIECFDSQHQALTLSDVARMTHISRATARRLLHTLAQLGYATFDGKWFRLAPRVLQLGYAYLSSINIWEIAQPFMVELVEKVHESCSASVLDGKDIVYVARVPTTQRIMSINLNIGTRLPAFATSMGRVLLAGLTDPDLDRYFAEAAPFQRYTEHTVTGADELRAIIDEVRRQGWAFVDQELEAGLRSIAVPIHDASRRTIAALNIGGHASRESKADMLERFLPALQEAAAKISRALATRHPGR